MKYSRKLLLGILASFGMLLLILDSRTALKGASEGVLLSIYTVVPSLFPFLFLSIFLSGTLSGIPLSFLRPLGKLCGIREGSEGIILAGLLGGYPAGAHSVYQAYKQEQITKNEAQRMLGFCNNAGPAFLFGMLSRCFSSLFLILILWLIHIVSAILTGILLPGKTRERCLPDSPSTISTSQALEKSIHAILSVCGWIILFRVIIQFISSWFLWLFPGEWQVLIIGSLELANGCVSLIAIKNEAIRFLLAGLLLSFGGVCVLMQTSSAVGELGIRKYLLGKLIQTGLSLFLGLLLLPFLFPGSIGLTTVIYGSVAFAIIAVSLFVCRTKKVVAFKWNMLYDNKNITQR